jgi:hypothetical protein
MLGFIAGVVATIVALLAFKYRDVIWSWFKVKVLRKSAE